MSQIFEETTDTEPNLQTFLEEEVRTNIKDFSQLRWVCTGCLCPVNWTNSVEMNSAVIDGTPASVVLCALLSALFESAQNDNDELIPKQLCEQCLLSLAQCHKFISRCQQSRQALMVTAAELKEREKSTQEEKVHVKEEYVEVKQEIVDGLQPIVFDPLTLKTVEEVQPPETIKTEQIETFDTTMVEEPTKDILEAINQKHSCKLYTCQYCSKIFTLVPEYTKHKEFCKRSSLNHVMKIDNTVPTKNPVEKPYICKFCKRAYKVQGSLIIHLKNQHNVKHPYSCRFCNEAFDSSYSLRYHINMHTGEKPYICRICKDTFSNPNDVQRHIKKHHSNGTTKDASAEDC